MNSSWYKLAVLACWLATMSWLVVEKILPTLDEGEPPTYASVLPAHGAESKPVCWAMHFGDQSIGWAASRAQREADGAGRLVSIVQFQNLPIDRLMTELLGGLGKWVGRQITGDVPLELDMTVESDMRVGPDGRMESFTTRIHLPSSPDFVRVEGRLEGHTLDLEIYTNFGEQTGDAPGLPHYRHQMDLPPDALVVDGLSPQTRLANLRVGQTWTFPTYRPFPPSSPVQMMQAKVEGEDSILHNGQSVRALQVVYRNEAAAAVSAARHPVGRLWVLADGTVLQQELHLASIPIRFVRLADDSCLEKADLLK